MNIKHIQYQSHYKCIGYLVCNYFSCNTPCWFGFFKSSLQGGIKNSRVHTLNSSTSKIDFIASYPSLVRVNDPSACILAMNVIMSMGRVQKGRLPPSRHEEGNLGNHSSVKNSPAKTRTRRCLNRFFHLNKPTWSSSSSVTGSSLPAYSQTYLIQEEEDSGYLRAFRGWTNQPVSTAAYLVDVNVDLKDLLLWTFETNYYYY